MTTTSRYEKNKPRILVTAAAGRNARAPGLDGRDLVAEVTCEGSYRWEEGAWPGVQGQVPRAPRPMPALKVVAYDFGLKRAKRGQADHARCWGKADINRTKADIPAPWPLFAADAPFAPLSAAGYGDSNPPGPMLELAL